MKKINWLFAVAALFAGGCTTKQIPVQVLRPGEITLPRSIAKVGITHRAGLRGTGPLQIFENGNPAFRFRDLRIVAPQSAVEAFYVEFSSFSRFEARVFTTSEKVDSQAVNIPLPNPETLKTWEKDSLWDAVISLDDFKAEMFSNGGIYPSPYYDTQGKLYTLPRFQEGRRIRFTGFWRVYDTRTGSVLLEKTTETDLFFTSNGFNANDIYRMLPERRGSVENTAQVNGISLARQFIPYWQTATRRIYLGQADPWLEAADSAEVGNWISALEQWERIEKKTVFRPFRRQVVYNLSVANEVLGRFEEAEKWAKYGQKKFKNREFDGSLLYIDRRRIENRELDEQLNE
jgi:hypothetical protein